MTVTGIDQTPTGNVLQSQQGLVISLTQSKSESEIEVIVTAQKEPEDVQDVPISITPITRQEIEDADITSLNGTFANAPNFSIFTASRNFIQYTG